MQKIYLLLRKNQQTGPFSIDELLQLPLQEDDLIWVEDRSVGWSYPYEIDTLQPFVKAPPAANTKGFKKVSGAVDQKVDVSKSKESGNKGKFSKNIFIRFPDGKTNRKARVAKPAADLEQKAAELKERILSAASDKVPEATLNATGAPVKESEPSIDLKTNYSKPLADVEEAYTSWVYKKKVKDKNENSKKALVVMGVALAVIITIVFFVRSFEDNNFTEEADNNTTVIENASLLSSSDNTDSLGNFAENDAVNDLFNSEAERGENKSIKSGEPTKEKKASLKVKKPDTENASENISSGTGNSVPDNKVAIITTEKEAAENKKKTISQKIEAIIGKLKTNKTNEEDRTEAATSPAENKKEAPKDLSSNVALSSNQTSANNWMLGVKGLKITMQNKGQETIKSAVVAVRYYNEEGDLMETKVVNFANIGNGKKATVAAPDHRLANHTDYVLLSANN